MLDNCFVIVYCFISYFFGGFFEIIIWFFVMFGFEVVLVCLYFEYFFVVSNSEKNLFVMILVGWFISLIVNYFNIFIYFFEFWDYFF